MNGLSTNNTSDNNQWLKRIESIVIFLWYFFKFKNLKNNLKLKFEIKEHSINGYLIFYSLNN